MINEAVLKALWAALRFDLILSALLFAVFVVSEETRPSDDDEERCDCKLPGYFCSGVAGILAHVEKGRLLPGAQVERCDACQRYQSDHSAYHKLTELGIA